MPARFCLTCGAVYPREAAPGYRCPGCQRGHDQQAEQQRARQRGSPAQRGYGASHRKVREQLLRQWKPGQLCSHCRLPMWDKTRLDLAHTADRSGYRGLAHAECNRGDK